VCHDGISVQNGAVTGFFSGVDLLFGSATVTGVHSHHNSNVGIRVSNPGIIRNSVADHNGAGLDVIDCPVLITNNAAMNNITNILVAPAQPNSCVVTNNAAP
jgi:hypothetical protein